MAEESLRFCYAQQHREEINNKFAGHQQELLLIEQTCSYIKSSLDELKEHNKRLEEKMDKIGEQHNESNKEVESIRTKINTIYGIIGTLGAAIGIWLINNLMGKL